MPEKREWKEGTKEQGKIVKKCKTHCTVPHKKKSLYGKGKEIATQIT